LAWGEEKPEMSMFVSLVYNFFPWKEMEDVGKRHREPGKEAIRTLLGPLTLPTPLSHLPSLPQQGVTTYFSGNCTMEDAKLAQDFLDSQVWGLGLRVVI
jgi:hypothetical protein